jgi:hypothetical protein
MLRKLIQALAIMALFAGTASAQDKAGIPLNYKPPPTQDDIERQKAADKAYDAAVQKIPDKKPPADPWGTIRPASPTPTASKSKQQ